MIWGNKDLQTFLSEGHIGQYRTCRGPDVLRDVIVAGYVILYKVNKFFVSTVYYFFIIDKMASQAGWNGVMGRIWPAGRSWETPVVE